jgi:hypothetical protein
MNTVYLTDKLIFVSVMAVSLASHAVRIQRLFFGFIPASKPNFLRS